MLVGPTKAVDKNWIFFKILKIEKPVHINKLTNSTKTLKYVCYPVISQNKSNNGLLLHNKDNNIHK